MSIPRLLILPLFVLSGCAGPQSGLWASWPWHAAGEGAPVSGAARHGADAHARFGFDWHLAGDREIMPLQVFDDGERMWLQFALEGAWPAVFDVGAGGWRPLRYRNEGPYMVLDGVYDRLELRGGHLRGGIRRAGSPAAEAPGRRGDAPPQLGEAPGRLREAPGLSGPGNPDSAAIVAVAEAPREPAGSGGLAASGGADPVAAASPAAVPAAVPGTVPAAVSEAAGAVRAEPSAASFAEPLALDHRGPPASLFSVSPADVTMRQALERWAAMAGWTFSAEHWAVDVDIPLVGQASFQADFRSAVRELLAATEMGDRPLQPCFYSNRVVRVVAHAQACDRRKGMGVMS